MRGLFRHLEFLDLHRIQQVRHETEALVADAKHAIVADELDDGVHVVEVELVQREVGLIIVPFVAL